MVRLGAKYVRVRRHAREVEECMARARLWAKHAPPAVILGLGSPALILPRRYRLAFSRLKVRKLFSDVLPYSMPREGGKLGHLPPRAGEPRMRLSSKPPFLGLASFLCPLPPHGGRRESVGRK